MPSRGLPRTAQAYLRDRLAPGGRVMRVRPLHGGISSSVHLVHLLHGDGAPQAVVVRRYGAYWQTTDPAACEREFLLLEALSRWPEFPAPRPLLLERDGGPFEAPTVVMTRLPGRPLLAPADVPGYLDQIAHLLARLHALPADEFTFLQDQRILVERTLTTYQPLEGDTLQAEILASARADWPAVERGMNERALVHGDYWPGNVLFRRGRLVGLIDWEQPRIGDPAKDVATARGDLSVLFGLEAANEFLRYYLEAGGRPIRNLRFWDLLISTWAVREIEDWAVVYPLLSRPDLTPAVARERIRAFATAALARYES